jgi:hypothetical protein
MPIKHIALLAGIVVFFFAVIAFTFLYGPGQRSFSARPQVLSVESTEQIAQTWETAGVKGRIAICFTRYLNALEKKESNELKVTERSMEKGVIRRVFHIAPDSAWPEISGALSKRNGIRLTSEGFIGIFDAGRVYIMPLSRFSQVTEKALIIIEPNVWTKAELMQIAEKLKSGRISTDLLVIIRGSEQDAALFRQALTH